MENDKSKIDNIMNSNPLNGKEAKITELIPKNDRNPIVHDKQLGATTPKNKPNEAKIPDFPEIELIMFIL